jgi:predicted nucleic acid-binding Zn ribbon protein
VKPQTEQGFCPKCGKALNISPTKPRYFCSPRCYEAMVREIRQARLCEAHERLARLERESYDEIQMPRRWQFLPEGSFIERVNRYIAFVESHGRLPKCLSA